MTLFWKLSAKEQAALMQLNYDLYGVKMEIPMPPPELRPVDDEDELEDYAREMRKAPDSPKRVT